MTGDWIKLHRQLIDSVVFADADLLRLWIWMLAKANFRKSHIAMTTGRGSAVVTVEPGQLIVGRKSGADQFGWSPSTFRNRLLRLQNLGMVEVKADRHWSVVSIVNWGKYQSEGDTKRTGNKTGGGQAKDSLKQRDLPDESDSGEFNVDNQVTGKGQPSNTQRTQDKNAKKVKKKEGGKAASSFDASQVELPESLDHPRFREAWADWIQHRKEKRKPLTETSVKLQLKELSGWGLRRAVAAINHSITKGWEGIFEPDGSSEANAPDAPKMPQPKRRVKQQ